MKIDQQTQKRLLSVREVSSVLGLSRATVYLLLSSGQLASIKVGRLRKVRPEAVEEFITSLEARGGFE